MNACVPPLGGKKKQQTDVKMRQSQQMLAMSPTWRVKKRWKIRFQDWRSDRMLQLEGKLRKKADCTQQWLAARALF
jgi:hypothetical protein